MTALSQIFLYPQRLWFLLLLALVYGGYLLTSRRAQRALDRPWRLAYGPAVHLENVAISSGFIRSLALFAACVSAVLAWARPQWGIAPHTENRESLELVIALDVSRSMDAEDLAPNRLARAKLSIERLLTQLGPDRVAVIVFAGEAQLLVPFTGDHQAVSLFLNGVDTQTLTYQGTALGNLATEVATVVEQTSPAEGTDRVLVIYTDGEDHEPTQLKRFSKLTDLGFRVLVIGCGTRQGVPIPLRNERGALSGYVRDAEKRVVTSKIHEDVLQEIAKAGNGSYLVLSPGTGSLDETKWILQNIQGLRRSAKTDTINAATKVERYQIFLAVALFLMFGAWLPSRWRHTRTASFLFFILFSLPEPAKANSLERYWHNREGRRALEKKDAAGAEKEFSLQNDNAKDSEDRARAMYNLGRALEEKGTLEEAAKAYQQSLQSQDPEARARSQFALGNLALKGNDESKALKHYKDSLKELSDVSKAPAWTNDLVKNLGAMGRPKPPPSQGSSSQDKKDQKDSQKGDQKDSQSQDGSEKKDQKDKGSEKPEDKKNDSPQESQKKPSDKEQKQGQQRRDFKGEDLSPSEAEQLLGALKDAEKKGLMKYLRTDKKKRPPTQTGKDW